MSKTLTLAATGLAGLVLGAGIGVAAASEDATPTRPERATAVTSMDEMHAAMVDTMPAKLAEQCNDMHTAMADHMGDGDHASMMEAMSSMMGGSMMDGMDATTGQMPADHDAHHPDTEE
jgi:hypothetical protein